MELEHGMANDSDCVFCAIKHVSSAYVLWTEYMQEKAKYRLEFVMSIGELHCAEMHMLKEFPELSSMVRELRLAMTEGADVHDEFRKIMLMLATSIDLFGDESN